MILKIIGVILFVIFTIIATLYGGMLYNMTSAIFAFSACAIVFLLIPVLFQKKRGKIRLLLVGTFLCICFWAVFDVWKTFYKIPEYLEINDQNWKRVKTAAASSWGYPCRYYRFSVPEDMIQIKDYFLSVAKNNPCWKTPEVITKSQILSKILERRQDPDKVPIEITNRLVKKHGLPVLAWEYAINTSSDFVELVNCFQSDPNSVNLSSYHFLTIRIHDKGKKNSLVEIYDFVVFDH